MEEGEGGIEKRQIRRAYGCVITPGAPIDDDNNNTQQAGRDTVSDAKTSLDASEKEGHFAPDEGEKHKTGDQLKTKRGINGKGEWWLSR